MSAHSHRDVASIPFLFSTPFLLSLELHRGINKNRKEWEKEHQLVIQNKCCENKNKMLKFEFELVLYLYRWEASPYY
jgi:hypothetical protein